MSLDRYFSGESSTFDVGDFLDITWQLRRHSTPLRFSSAHALRDSHHFINSTFSLCDKECYSRHMFRYLCLRQHPQRDVNKPLTHLCMMFSQDAFWAHFAEVPLEDFVKISTSTAGEDALELYRCKKDFPPCKASRQTRIERKSARRNYSGSIPMTLSIR